MSSNTKKFFIFIKEKRGLGRPRRVTLSKIIHEIFCSKSEFSCMTTVNSPFWDVKKTKNGFWPNSFCSPLDHVTVRCYIVEKSSKFSKKLVSERLETFPQT